MAAQELHAAHTRSAVAEQAWLVYCPDGQEPEHVTQDPCCPPPQPATNCPEAQVTGLGQLAHTRFAVAVQPDTSYWDELQAVQGTAATIEKVHMDDE